MPANATYLMHSLLFLSLHSLWTQVMKAQGHPLSLLLAVSRAALILLFPFWLYMEGSLIIWGGAWTALGSQVCVRI